jgi:hypothetical protein
MKETPSHRRETHLHALAGMELHTVRDPAAVELADTLAGLRIPQADRLVIAAAKELFAVAVEADVADSLRVAYAVSAPASSGVNQNGNVGEGTGRMVHEPLNVRSRRRPP